MSDLGGYEPHELPVDYAGKLYTEQQVEGFIDLSGALETQRVLQILDDVMHEQIGGLDSIMPTPFQAGYHLACEESMYRIRAEVSE